MRKAVFIIAAIAALGSCKAITDIIDPPKEEKTVPSPVGQWRYASGTGAWQQISGMVSVRSDGSFISGGLSGSIGDFAQVISVGRWTQSGGAGTILSYDSLFDPSLSAPSSITAFFTEDGKTMTLSATASGQPVTSVFARIASPAADPAVGLWNFTSGTGSWVPLSGILSVHSDGTFYAADLAQIGASTYTQVISAGTWSNSSGAYAVTTYGTQYDTTQDTAQYSTGALSNGNNTMTFSTMVSGLPVTAVYTRVASPSASDPAIGLWTFSSATGSWIPLYGIISVQADGSFIDGSLSGSAGNYSQIAGVGQWTKTGGSTYSTLSYGSMYSNGQSAPSAATLTISGGTMTIQSQIGTSTYTKVH